jgi:aspartyl-tRNA(Asn)/glutamyl-tRNA(Gln) amidotransferase subunit C
MPSVDVRHLAQLARLELTEAEAEKVPDQIEAILDYIGKLSEVDTSGVSDTAFVTDARNVWREDQEAACEEEVRRRCLDAFPKRRGDALEVPGVFEGTDEAL